MKFLEKRLRILKLILPDDGNKLKVPYIKLTKKETPRMDLTFSRDSKTNKSNLSSEGRKEISKPRILWNLRAICRNGTIEQKRTH